MDSNFVKPRYDAGGFTGIHQRITDLLSGGQYDAVVLFLIDGFGWRFFEKFQDEPFLQYVAHEGVVTKLTSQFPSTTAALLTTLHTGLPVGEHGVFEWIYYEPTLDAVIAPLLFSFAGTAERETLKPHGVKPRHILPTATFYQKLKKQGVNATIFQHREYTPSTYSDVIFTGATSRGYRDLPEALVTLSEKITESKPPAYFVAYYEKIDSVGHEYGPEAPQTEAEIQVFLMTMESIFRKAMSRSGKRTLCLLTADHGQSEVDPQTTVYLNRDPAFAGVEKFFKTDGKGDLIVPAGSARDFFLYVKEEQVDEARAFLAPRLEGRAEVRKVAEMMEAGYFGPIISPIFRARVGNLVILPYRGETVWWYEKDKYEQKFRGHHGGLTAKEMEIPLAMWEM